MITEKIIENGLVERKSDRAVYIKNIQTGFEYTEATDLPNEKRISMGLQPYFYIETEKPIEQEELELILSKYS